MSKKRKVSSSFSGADDDLREVQRRTPSPESGLATLSRSIRGLFERISGGGENNGADTVDPVVNPATAKPSNFVRNLIGDIASQLPRLGENIGLLTSMADMALFAGGLADDRKYQVEQILQLAASLPPDSKALGDLTTELIKALWVALRHPPLSYEGDEFKYRMADGSNNNIMYPQLGAAGSSYARTVKPETLQPGVLPDPAVIFDSIFARGTVAREHPSKISSMLFYLASIIIHDVFHTDEQDYSRVKSSSYLDLAPLYGSSQADQDKVRLFVDGLLKPDTYSETRVLGFPPGVSALLICFNRYHNYIVRQLKDINEGGRFSLPPGKPSKKALAKQDNDLFQTARLITCGLYVNIILTDYVRTILALNRVDSTWTLDPRNDFADVFDSQGTPSGVGNQVSVEFNLIYRWHSAISVKDEKWTYALYQSLFPGRDPSSVTEQELVLRLRKWGEEFGNMDPSQWPLDGGKYTRNANGTFEDSDLAQILTDATEDVACAFGPRNVPVVMKLIETMGMKQARSWNVATLNEFRKFFKLEPHKEFSDITTDVEVAEALKSLYTHPDYVELYPGLVAEDAKIPLEPGSGLCPGYTVSRSILSDAVTLTRGDRFYTVDYSPANLTNWGWNQVKSDKDVASGHVIYNLLMRALPFWYRGNSVYAMYPFVVPSENRQILQKLKTEHDYSFDRPSYIGVPTVIKTWKGVTSVLADQARFKVPWGPHTYYLTHHDYMLSGDGPEEAVQKADISEAMYCPVNGLKEVQQFYESLTTQLVDIRSDKLREKWYQLDAVRDVGNASHAIFVARLFHIPLKSPGDLKLGVTVDQFYLVMSVLFAYVFLDLDTARSFKLRAGAKQATDQIAKLVKLVVEAVKVGKMLHLNNLPIFGSSGQLLADYGSHLISRMLQGGKSVDDVVYALIPTAAAAVATQGQHFAQMLDVYLRDEYADHWPAIQACAYSDDPADFEKLKDYALEANRLNPAAFGLLRTAAVDVTVADGTGPKHKVKVGAGESVYTDFISAGLDPITFPNPTEIKLGRGREKYLHHGWGPHKCLGRPIVEVAMASQLKVFAKLKNLRRAPGPQGELKFQVPTSPDPEGSEVLKTPGRIMVFMHEDWSDWWPFPTTMKVHHDGFAESQEELLAGKTGLPHVDSAVHMSDMSQANGRPTKDLTV